MRDSGPAGAAHGLPRAEITLITLPMLHDLAERLPSVDRFSAFPGYPGLAEQLFDARKAAWFFDQMQAERFDLAIQMQGSGLYSNPFTLMLGARQTAGFIRPGDLPGRLDAALPLPETGHEIERVLSLVTFLGAASKGLEVELNLRPEDFTAADILLYGARLPLIGIHTGARDRTRRWPPERFARAGAQLRQAFGGTLVLVGDDGELAAARVIQDCAGSPILDLIGRTSLPVLGALLTRLSVLITNDTGPAHLAYALGTPVVTIFGGADPSRYGPLQPGPFRTLVHPIACRPCMAADCPIAFECLEKVSEESVVAAALEVFGNKQ